MLKKYLKNFAKNNIKDKMSATACGWYEPKLTEKIKAEIIKDEK